jgi:hypothetical protein
MIICFQCSPEIKKSLDNLLEAGQYTDYSEVISMALRNLAVLHNQISESGILFIEEKPRIGISNKTELDLAVNETGGLAKKKEEIGIINKQSEGARTKLQEDIPEIFRITNDFKAPNKFAKMPSDIWIAGQDIPLDRWFFGQYNRLLPAKASCRALVHMNQINPNGVDLSSTASAIASQATILGDYLTNLDEVRDHNREDAVSTAFPTSGENASKSQMRYANQFVASINKRGQISGLLVSLKLINLTLGKNDRILLTEPGWEFARLLNPILDKKETPNSRNFNDEEIQFLINHISNNVPTEDFAYRTILTIIEKGINSPLDIDGILSQQVPLSKNRSLSQSFLSSQRSGAISRMTDLGLLERERDGIRMFYKITEWGRMYLTTNN